MESIIPKISVIVPVYKAEKYLHKCVDSILAQTFNDFELLLVDDGSPDRSGEICDEYAAKDSRIKVFHKENGGVSSARNLGISKAIADWITFIDADDFIAPSFLENLYRPIEKGDKIDFVHAGCSNYCDGTISVNQSYAEKKDNTPAFLAVNLRGLIVSKLFNRHILQNHHIVFDERVEIAEDMIFTFDYIQYVDYYVFLSEKGYYYRIDNMESATKCGKVRSYQAQYYGFKRLYNSVVEYVEIKDISRDKVCSRFINLGNELFNVLHTLYITHTERRVRLNHLKNDFKDYKYVEYVGLHGWKQVLIKIFNRGFYNIFDSIMWLLCYIHRALKTIC